MGSLSFIEFHTTPSGVISQLCANVINAPEKSLQYVLEADIFLNHLFVRKNFLILSVTEVSGNPGFPAC